MSINTFHKLFYAGVRLPFVNDEHVFFAPTTGHPRYHSQKDCPFTQRTLAPVSLKASSVKASQTCEACFAVYVSSSPLWREMYNTFPIMRGELALFLKRKSTKRSPGTEFLLELIELKTALQNMEDCSEELSEIIDEFLTSIRTRIGEIRANTTPGRASASNFEVFLRWAASYGAAQSRGYSGVSANAVARFRALAYAQDAPQRRVLQKAVKAWYEGAADEQIVLELVNSADLSTLQQLSYVALGRAIEPGEYLDEALKEAWLGNVEKAARSLVNAWAMAYTSYEEDTHEMLVAIPAAALDTYRPFGALGVETPAVRAVLGAMTVSSNSEYLFIKVSRGADRALREILTCSPFQVERIRSAPVIASDTQSTFDAVVALFQTGELAYFEDAFSVARAVS